MGGGWEKGEGEEVEEPAGRGGGDVSQADRSWTTDHAAGVENPKGRKACSSLDLASAAVLDWDLSARRPRKIVIGREESRTRRRAKGRRRRSVERGTR